MCNSCVMERVRESVRRHPDAFERAAAVARRARAKGAEQARLNLSRCTGKAVDLTHAYDATFPTYDGPPGISMKRTAAFDRDGFNVFRLTIDEHTGTHVDAPLHCTADGASLTEMDAQDLIAPLCIISIADKARADVNATVSAEDVERWMSANGQFPEGACVAMNSGWAHKVKSSSFRNTPDGALAFPGFSQEAAEILADMGVAALAVDTLSLDAANAADFPAHRTFLGRGGYGIECLNNLDLLPATGATIFVGAPAHKGGTGGPARVLALL